MTPVGNVRASEWPEADRLFRSDPRWLGGDAAYSVPLSGDRTLWLFGDTFVAEPGRTRADAIFVHNTIGLQDGRDPSTATMTFHHRGTPADPQPFFAAPEGTWLWPMDGVRVGRDVVVFFMRVRSARPDLSSVLDAWREEGSLRFFEVFDWTAALIRDPGKTPSDWRVEMLDTPPAINRIMPGAGAVVWEDRLYVYGWRDGHTLRPGWVRRRPRYRGYRHPRLAFAVRWPAEQVPAGLHDPEWWCGDRWACEPDRAVPVIEDPATEFTVHRDERSAGFVLVGAAPWLPFVDAVPRMSGLRVLKRHPVPNRVLQMLRIMKVSVTIRWAPAPEGPWTDSVRVYTPKVGHDVHVYAGKGHPQLSGADLVCTVMRIIFDADRTVGDDSVYFPRFVRLDIGD